MFTLRDPARRVLLQHRDDDAPLHPGTWGFFGGAVEPGEAVSAGLLREAREELDLRLELDALWKLPVKVVRDPDAWIELHAWVGRWDGDVAALRAAQTEGQGLAFWSIEQALGLQMIPYLYDTLREIAAR